MYRQKVDFNFCVGIRPDLHGYIRIVNDKRALIGEGTQAETLACRFIKEALINLIF